MITSVSALIADRLRQRARARGADPLLTYYDLDSGERTELSATSFLNWVDKTSNLLTDEYSVGDGDVVDLVLAERFPGHWITFVIELAVWQVGATVRVGRAPAPAHLLVLGPDFQDHDSAGASAVLACALHPLGLGFGHPLAAGIDDFSLEVRGQPDLYFPEPRSGLAPAWLDGQRQLTQQDLIAVEGEESGRRWLVTISDPWSSVRDGLLVPLLTGGSTVLVVGDDPGRLDRIRQTEQVDSAVASDGPS